MSAEIRRRGLTESNIRHGGLKPPPTQLRPPAPQGMGGRNLWQDRANELGKALKQVVIAMEKTIERVGDFHFCASEVAVMNQALIKAKEVLGDE